MKKDTERFIDLFKQAGCHLFSFGLEAVSPEILKNVNRHPQTPEELAKIIKIAKEKGILTVLHLLLGLPGETGKAIQERIDYIFKVKPHYVRLNRLIPVEGSELGQRPSARICDFSDDEIERWCKKIIGRFYTSPAIVVQNVRYILRNDPLWFFRALRFAGHIKRGLGI
ncbi:MAG: hypothetical protein COT22_00810 [Ignavibacteria bacterium CG08_land_8_20_14_0_20_37_9]|nr:MAG: hypothetical protein COT22_00810 [Ignavibacteria bacterium CG08_land_8_20_14_0_20_37_9]